MNFRQTHRYLKAHNIALWTLLTQVTTLQICRHENLLPRVDMLIGIAQLCLNYATEITCMRNSLCRGS